MLVQGDSLPIQGCLIQRIKSRTWCKGYHDTENHVEAFDRSVSLRLIISLVMLLHVHLD